MSVQLSRPSPPKRSLPLLLGAAVAWAVFAAVAVTVVRTGRVGFDKPILLYWYRHATPWLDQAAVFLTVVGNTWPMVGLGTAVFAALLVRRENRAAWRFAASVGGSMVLTQVIKALVARPRPDFWVSIHPEHTYSFPSGHAMDTAAVAAALSLLWWRRPGRRVVWTVAPLFALSVGWARVYLGVHNPSDVLAGWASALGWVMGIEVLIGPAQPARPPASGALPGSPTREGAG